MGVPPMSSRVDITIRVSRNEHSPRFTEFEYEASVDETARYGVAIVKCIATDEDLLTQDVSKSRPLW